MQRDPHLQTRTPRDPASHRTARRLAAAALLGAVALACAHRADAEDIGNDVRSFAIASLARQDDLGLRLTGGQTDNLKAHLENLRGDACGPIAVRVSLGQIDAAAAWERLVAADEEEDVARSKTLATTSTTERCANAARPWTGGAVTLASDAPDPSGHDFERVETNLSAGLDARIAADLALGIAVGGSNGDTIESEGRTRGRAALGSISAYASYHPTRSTFAEAAIGVARLDVTDRVIGMADALSGASARAGLGGFATLAVGRVEKIGDLALSPYLKASGQIVRLGAIRQRIEDADYRVDARGAARLGATVGIDASLPLRRLPDWIAVTPRAGMEIGYSLNRRGETTLAATGSHSTQVVAGTLSTGRTLRLDVGAGVRLFDEVSVDLDVETRPIAEGRPKTLRLSSSWNF